MRFLNVMNCYGKKFLCGNYLRNEESFAMTSVFTTNKLRDGFLFDEQSNIYACMAAWSLSIGRRFRNISFGFVWVGAVLVIRGIASPLLLNCLTE